MSYSTSIFVDAAPDAVFDCLVIPEMMVRWMGERALLQAVAGGRFEVDINGVLIRGQFIEIERPRRLVVSWGQLGNALLPPGASRVTFELSGERDGTLVRLIHDDLPAPEANKHAVGWPHFLGPACGCGVRRRARSGSVCRDGPRPVEAACKRRNPLWQPEKRVGATRACTLYRCGRKSLGSACRAVMRCIGV